MYLIWLDSTTIFIFDNQIWSKYNQSYIRLYHANAKFLIKLACKQTLQDLFNQKHSDAISLKLLQFHVTAQTIYISNFPAFVSQTPWHHFV